MRASPTHLLLAALSALCACGAPPAVDGGVLSDAGQSLDAGAPVDAGATTDAGSSQDAGLLDAGLDAGPLDAGADAGRLDAGADAGPLDAGLGDGGFDAGVDAGSLDAGLSDAGFDAGLELDGGFTDAGVWTWLWQNVRPDSLPVWGVLGQVDAGNDPGRRSELSFWAGPDGGLIIFGGYLASGSGSVGPANDLWRFDGRHWVHLAGAASVNALASYGTLGVRSCTTWPGARSSAMSWSGPDGGLYVYGGEGYVTFGQPGRLSDVWRYDGCWTWVAGTQQKESPHLYPDAGVTTPTPGARTQGHVWSDGRTAWLFGGLGPNHNFADVWRFDGRAWTLVHGPNPAPPVVSTSYGQRGVASSTNTPGSRTGSATWLDAAGHLWLYGGQGLNPAANGRLADLWKFDGAQWTWVGGTTALEAPPSRGALGFASSTNSPGTRTQAVVWHDGTDVWLFGGFGVINQTWADLWKWDGRLWTWVAGADQPNQYPTRGTLGVPSLSNRPGSRAGSAVARLADGVYLYGGTGLDLSSTPTLGEVWRYQP